MSAEDDARAASAVSAALAQSFEDWANLPETRKLLRQSVAGKVKRRDLMKAAHAIGVRDGASIYKATIAMMLGRALGRPDDTDVDTMLEEVAQRCSRPGPDGLAEVIEKMASEAEHAEQAARCEFDRGHVAGVRQYLGRLRAVAGE